MGKCVTKVTKPVIRRSAYRRVERLQLLEQSRRPA